MQEACKLSSNVLLISDAHRQLTFNDVGRKKFKLLGGAKNENEQKHLCVGRYGKFAADEKCLRRNEFLSKI